MASVKLLFGSNHVFNTITFFLMHKSFFFHIIFFCKICIVIPLSLTKLTKAFRYVAEGGLTGERKRWVPRRGKTPLDPDAEGYIYSNPIESSFKQRCLEEWRIYHRKLLTTLRNEGPAILGNVSEYDYLRVEERLKKIVKGPEQKALKPKAASKMIVSELKEELEAQGLPTDGTRNVLYQRVQKARRINLSRGRPLWVPPVEEEEEEVHLIDF